MEVVIAPSYSEEARAIFSAKPNLRILEMPLQSNEKWEMKFVTGGMLLQEKDLQTLQANDLKIVTKKQPNAKEIEAIGATEYFGQKDTVIVIEWAEKIKSILSRQKIEINIKLIDKDEREIIIKKYG